MPRRKSTRETHDERFTLTLKPSMKLELEEFATMQDRDMSDVMRDGAQTIMRGLLPVLGRIPCGELREAIQESDVFELVPPCLKPRADSGDYLLEASGDSMAPLIQDGDLVLLRPEIEPANGDICAVQVYRDRDTPECDATLKRLHFLAGSAAVELQPENDRYQPMAVDRELIKVIGVYRGLIRRQR